ncbi:hypothetical protein HY004_03285 [Candidatus Saccharibacteria bacterium]|nr:hypothetical protein [Candidatus Saccharibacteria bacterium]
MRRQLEQDIAETATDVDSIPEIDTNIRTQLAIDISETAALALELDQE